MFLDTGVKKIKKNPVFILESKLTRVQKCF